MEHTQQAPGNITIRLSTMLVARPLQWNRFATNDGRQTTLIRETICAG